MTTNLVPPATSGRSQPISPLGEGTGKLDSHFRCFPSGQAMFDDELSEQTAIGASRQIVSRRDGKEGARVVVEAHRVVEAGRFGGRLAEPAHAFGTVVEPPCGAEPQRR